MAMAEAEKSMAHGEQKSKLITKTSIVKSAKEGQLLYYTQSSTLPAAQLVQHEGDMTKGKGEY